jgi:hypothetical protein
VFHAKQADGKDGVISEFGLSSMLFFSIHGSAVKAANWNTFGYGTRAIQQNLDAPK